MTDDAEWEERLARLWATMADHAPAVFLGKIAALTAELPAHSPIATFELAAANDSTGHSDVAAPLYEAALAAGLCGLRRRRAVIQLASSLRNLGQAARSIALLTQERDAGSDELDDAVIAFLALALADVGREKEAVAMTVLALSRHLNRYNRSLANYAKELAEDSA